jgi:hypothetical protein
MTLSFNEIDKALEYFEQKNFSEASEKDFLSKYPNFTSFLTSSQFDALTEDEFLILMFDALIVIKAYSDMLGSGIDADSDLIESLETQNWDKYEELGNISFFEKVQIMMGKEQLELSDFIISSFEMEEEDNDENPDPEISLPAKEIIFITVKTIADSINFSIK